jgi:hypothetical protein
VFVYSRNEVWQNIDLFLHIYFAVLLNQLTTMTGSFPSPSLAVIRCCSGSRCPGSSFGAEDGVPLVESNVVTLAFVDFDRFSSIKFAIILKFNDERMTGWWTGKE